MEKSLQAPDYYTDEYQGEIKKSNEIIAEYIEFKTNTKGGGSGALSVPVYEQEYDFHTKGDQL